MKTPREILFKRHREVESKLDAIRENVIAEHIAAGNEKQSALRTTSRQGSLVIQLWQELVRPYRRIWAGVGAAWVVIIALRMTEPGTAARETVRISPQMAAAVIVEQRRELALVLGETEGSQPVPSPQPPLPRPRSERRVNAVAV